MELFDISYIVLAIIAVVIVSIPLYLRQHVKWFSCWNLVLFTVVAGVFLRAIHISFDYPSSERIKEAFLLDQPKDVLLWPMVVVIIGLTSMTIGYLWSTRVKIYFHSRLFDTECWNHKRFYLVIISFLTVACISQWFIIKSSFVDFMLANLSKPRGISTDLDVYRGLGILRVAAGLSPICAYLTVTKLISERKMSIFDSFLFMFIIGSNLAYLLFMNSRSYFIAIILYVIIIAYFLYGQRLTRKLKIVAITSIIIGIFMVGIMTQFRGGNYFEENNDIFDILVTTYYGFVLNNTSMDVSKTAHIMAAIPDRLDYQWGKTILLTLLILIPRDLWPTKPFVNADTIVGMVVYGANHYGAGAVPTGLIAEMYWNFYYPGIIAGCFALGYFLRLIDVHFKVYSTNRNAIILYVPFIMQLGNSFLGSSIANVIVGVTTSLIPLYIALLFINKGTMAKENK